MSTKPRNGLPFFFQILEDTSFFAHNGYLRFTSGATPANLLMANMAADHVPHMHIAEVGAAKI